jgi:undecaprenyl-diphosphatase
LSNLAALIINGLVQKLEQIDRDIFLYLNGKHIDSLDGLMVLASGRFTWIPLYIVLFIMVVIAYRKRWWLIAISAGILVLLSDQLSGVVKHTVQRYRPCYNLEIQDIVYVTNGCGGQYGFVSSHAANTFGLALLLTLVLRKKWRFFPYFIFTWAMFVSYSRIYNGVHYPADLAGGGLLGMALALIVYRLFIFTNKRLDERLIQKELR